jgi:translation initiation factor IF-2
MSEKVRIYELSRELNLDNRDILAVCEQLNISVKSHSSTITEDDAARIRAYSEKHPEARSLGVMKNKASFNPDYLESGGKKKLEIRQFKKSQDHEQQFDISSQVDQTEVKQLQPPPVKKQSNLSMQQPTLSKQSEILEPSINQAADVATSVREKEASPVQVNSSSESQYSEELNAASSMIATENASDSDAATAGNLMAPPVRPEPPQKKSREGGKNRPIPKNQQKNKPQKAAVPKSPVSESSPSEISGHKEEVKKPSQSAKTSPSRQKKTASAPTKSVPELVRPRASVPVVSKVHLEDEDQPVETDAIVDFDEEIVEIEKPRLKRPLPPKSAKKSKKQKDGKDVDDEENQELIDGSAKKVAAGKRRLKPLKIEDDDDDFDSELDLNNAITKVGLSIARPPKAKSSSGTPPKTPGPSTGGSGIKAKKPDRDGSSSANRRSRRQETPGKQQRPEKITMTGLLTIRELAELMAVPETEIVKTLFFKGIAVNITQSLDYETAKMVAEEFEIQVEAAEAKSEAKKVREFLNAEDLDNLQWRPPVVTIMGHVDHGKTTLLDSIRKTKVAQGEAGGITQHIGAYHVDVEYNGALQQVVFLDTPGHEAFTAMRARGTRVTDIAILVVAADDGVQPQTVEAISHAKAAEVPIIVAINKIDKEGAQPERVMQQLAEYGLVSEEWGGDTTMVPISAMKGQNLDNLLEMILLQAEIEELSANPDRAAVGTVIEAHLDKAKGPVASLLVQNGTLRVGDILVAGSTIGKVRAMIDDRGQRVEEARPSFAVEVLGLNDVPAAGDDFEVFENEKDGRAVAEARAAEKRASRLQQTMASRRVTLTTISEQAKEGELKDLNLILKADVQGSVEAILQSLEQLPQNEVQVRVLLSAPGEITETDVDLAAASNAVIIGFNTTFAPGARHAADQAGVDVRDYDIIYNLLDDIRAAMEGLLEPELVEENLGQAEVRAVFSIGKGAVAGCYIQNGKVIRNCKVRVRRRDQVIYEGMLDSLKRMKEDAREVNTGYECGIGIDSFSDWNEGDIIEAYRMVTKRRTLASK